MKYKFKRENPDASERKRECDKIREQFPDKIPIICEKAPNAKLGEIDKTKYLVPNDLTVSQFSFTLRKRLEIKKEDAFFLLVNGKHTITGDINLGEIYEKYADKEDGFLYIVYASQETWG